MDRGERRPAARTSGLSVGAKFSIATSAVVAGSMLVFAVVLYGVVSGVVSKEIDEAGISAVRAMVAGDISAWQPYFGTVAQGREAEVLESGKLTLPPGELPRFNKQHEYNKQRAQKIAEAAGTKILDAVVLDAAARAVINGAGPISFDQTGSERSVGQVRILEGFYQRTTPARTFSAPFRDADDEVRGYGVLVLSEERIDQTLSRLVRIIGFLALLFVGLGLLSSWLVAQRITQPVVTLVEDMEIVSSGDLDHRTRAHSTDEIGLLARAFDKMTQSVKVAHDRQREQAAQEHQLAIAQEIQEALIPEQLIKIEGHECGAFSRASSNVTSNYYDVVQLDEGRYLLVLASASGTGIPGAMVVTMARSLLKALAPRHTSPAELLREVNRHLSPDLRRGMYVTVLAAQLDQAAGRVTYANAGHHPLVVCRRGEEGAVALHSDGIALGFDKGPVFDRTISDAETELAPGDRLMFCTQSLFEIENPQGKSVSEQVVYRLFARESPKNTEAFFPLVIHGLDAFRSKAEFDQDLTLLTIKRLA